MKKIRQFLIILLALVAGKTFSQPKDITLSISPNTFSDLATIQFDIIQTETITLKVYDRTGLNVRTFFESIVFPSGSYKVNVLGDNLANGMYIVKLYNGSAKPLTQKVIKNSKTRSAVDNPFGKKTTPNPALNSTQGKELSIINTKGLIKISKKEGLETALKTVSGVPLFNLDPKTAHILAKRAIRSSGSSRIDQYLIN